MSGPRRRDRAASAALGGGHPDAASGGEPPGEAAGTGRCTATDGADDAAPRARRAERFTTAGWASKSLAGALLGFSLSIALAGVLMGLSPRGLTPDNGKVQLAMWLVAPIWMTVLSTCFLFRTGWRAWGWLGAANALAFAALWAFQTIHSA